MTSSYPQWWPPLPLPAPAAWQYVHEAFTADDTGDEWAIAAAVFVAQTRRETSLGPTFTELFLHLLPESDGLPSPLPRQLHFFDRRRAISAFRSSVAIDWRRRSMIGWDRDVPRSLRVGRELRARSRNRPS